MHQRIKMDVICPKTEESSECFLNTITLYPIIQRSSIESREPLFEENQPVVLSQHFPWHIMLQVNWFDPGLKNDG